MIPILTSKEEMHKEKKNGGKLSAAAEPFQPMNSTMVSSFVQFHVEQGPRIMNPHTPEYIPREVLLADPGALMKSEKEANGDVIRV